MKRLILPVLLCLLLSCPAFAARLELQVSGVEDTKGQIIASVFDSEENFLEIPMLQMKNRPAADEPTVFVFENLPPGNYALSAVHDRDGNGEMNSNFLGIPKEPVAVSNNAKGRFGPPAFEDARFPLEVSGRVMHIQLKKLK